MEVFSRWRSFLDDYRDDLRLQDLRLSCNSIAGAGSGVCLPTLWVSGGGGALHGALTSPQHR